MKPFSKHFLEICNNKYIKKYSTNHLRVNTYNGCTSLDCFVALLLAKTDSVQRRLFGVGAQRAPLQLVHSARRLCERSEAIHFGQRRCNVKKNNGKGIWHFSR